MAKATEPSQPQPPPPPPPPPPVPSEAETLPFLHTQPPHTICYGIPAPLFQPYIVLHRTRLRRPRRCHCGCSLLLPSLLLLLCAAAFLLWPSDPEVRVVRLHLDNVRLRTSPIPVLDISLGLQVRVRNRDFFSVDYRSIVTSIGYRGRRLGFVTSGGGRIRARGVSYIEANLKLDGIRLIHDVFYLIEDLARGFVPFDTVTQVDGTIHALFLDIPIQGRISCSVSINPDNQTVIRQDCY